MENIWTHIRFNLAWFQYSYQLYVCFPYKISTYIYVYAIIMWMRQYTAVKMFKTWHEQLTSDRANFVPNG